MLSMTLWPGALAEMVVMLVTLGILLNVALTHNLLIGTLTDGSSSQLTVEWFLRDVM